MKYTSLQTAQFRKLEKQANKLLRTKQEKKKFAAYTALTRRNNKYVHELRVKATPEEVIVGKWLLEQGIYFIFQKGFFRPFHRIVDFYLPRRGIIEIDGGYHEAIKDKDDNKDYMWGKFRYLPTLRVTNDQVLDGSFKELIISFIGTRKFKRDKTHKSKYPKNWNDKPSP